MKKLFLLLITIAFIFMGCVTTNGPIATTVVEEPVVENQKTPEEIEAENLRAELLSNSTSIDAENPNIRELTFGSTLDDVISSLDGIDTLSTIWFPTTGYSDLSERPKTAYYIYENSSFLIKDRIVEEMSLMSSNYNYNGLMVGDREELIDPVMGEPDSQWELLIPRYYEYNMGAYFVVIEVAKGDDVIREIAFSTEAREKRE